MEAISYPGHQTRPFFLGGLELLETDSVEKMKGKDIYIVK